MISPPTRINYAQYSATDGAQVFLKYGLVAWYTQTLLVTKGLQYSILGKEVVYLSSLFFPLSLLLPIPPLNKVDPFISKLLRVFHQECLVPYKYFSFPIFLFELINIHPLYLISWNVNMNWRGSFVISLVAYFWKNIYFPYQKNFH